MLAGPMAKRPIFSTIKPVEIRNRTTSATFCGGMASASAIRSGIAVAYLGMALGVTTLSTEQFFSFGGTGSVAESVSRLGLGPLAGVDVQIVSGVFVNLSAQYLASLGASPRPGIASFMVGPGYRF